MADLEILAQSASHFPKSDNQTLQLSSTQGAVSIPSHLNDQHMITLHNCCPRANLMDGCFGAALDCNHCRLFAAIQVGMSKSEVCWISSLQGFAVGTLQLQWGKLQGKLAPALPELHRALPAVLNSRGKLQ